MARPGGDDRRYSYDAAARLTSIAQPRGHDAVHLRRRRSGRLATATAPGDERIAYAYDGSLPTRVTFSGTIAGEVGFTYDADLRLATETVGGANGAAYTYDEDGLLTKARARSR